MESSSFSSGTERAVKTWQASLDAPQDGIMTAELLEQLYTAAQIEGLDNKGSTLTAAQKEDTNGAAVTSATEISEVQQTLVKEGVTEVEVSEHRVFLLERTAGKILPDLAGTKNKEVKARKGMPQQGVLLVEGRVAYCAQNVMEQASQTLKNSSWIGWKREQNVHIVKVMGLQFATYVKGQLPKALVAIRLYLPMYGRQINLKHAQMPQFKPKTSTQLMRDSFSSFYIVPVQVLINIIFL